MCGSTGKNLYKSCADGTTVVTQEEQEQRIERWHRPPVSELSLRIACMSVEMTALITVHVLPAMNG